MAKKKFKWQEKWAQRLYNQSWGSLNKFEKAIVEQKYREYTTGVW